MPLLKLILLISVTKRKNENQEENCSKMEDKGNKKFIRNLELKPVNKRKENTVRGMKRRNMILEKIIQLRIIEGMSSFFY